MSISMQTQNLSPTQLNIDLTNQQDKNITLQFELKLLQLYGPALGIYALPNLSDPLIWNGVVFVHNGYYKEGKFKFNMHMHDFPKNRPKIYFTSKLFHALVDELSGQLDVGSTMADLWDYGNESMLYNLMNDLSKLFVDKRRFSNMLSYNPSAAQLFESNTHEFIIKCMRCVGQTGQKMQQLEKDQCYKIGQQTYKIQEIKETLNEVCQGEGQLEQKVQMFLQKLLQ